MIRTGLTPKAFDYPQKREFPLAWFGCTVFGLEASSSVNTHPPRKLRIAGMSDYQIAKDLLQLQQRLDRLESDFRKSAGTRTADEPYSFESGAREAGSPLVDGLTASFLGVEPGAQAASKSFPFDDMKILAAHAPRNERRLAWTFKEIFVTLVKALDRNGREVCSAILSLNVTSNSEDFILEAYGHRWQVVLKNAQGAAVHPTLHLDPLISLACQWSALPVTYSARVEPDVYDLVERVTITFPPTTRGECRPGTP